MNAHSKQDIPGVARSVARDPRWARIVARDKSADGEFWYSVTTTGVYCRPSCPSRRCKPDGPSTGETNAAAVAKACQWIDEAEVEPSLDEIAKVVKFSPYHFHRVF